MLSRPLPMRLVGALVLVGLGACDDARPEDDLLSPDGAVSDRPGAAEDGAVVGPDAGVVEADATLTPDGDGDGLPPRAPARFPVLPPGPAVTLSPNDAREFGYLFDTGPCFLQAGDLMCVAEPSTVASRVRSGPYRGFEAFAGYVCALRTDQTLDCFWTTPRDADPCGADSTCIDGQPAPSGRFLDVAVGVFRACAVRDSGALVCWGLDYTQDVTPMPSESDFVSVSVARDYACAVRQSGAVACWGQLALSVTATPFAGRVVQKIEARDGSACALFDEGEVACEGFFSTPLRFVDPPVVKGVVRMSAGAGGLCVLDAAGAARCYGEDRLARVAPHGGPFREVLALGSAACGLRADGVVQCWGGDYGNGAGPEKCDVGRATLRIDDAAPEAYGIEVRGFSQKAYRDDIGGAAEPAGAMYLRPGEPAESTHAARQYTTLRSTEGKAFTALADGESTPVAGYWSQGLAGEVLCVAPTSGSTLRRRGDEYVLDLQKVARLPACPGTPLAGSVDIVQNATNQMPISGSVDGVDWPPAYLDTRVYTEVVDLEFSDATRLFMTADAWNRGPSRWQGFHPGHLYPSLEAPRGGEVLCVGSASYATNGAGDPVLRLSDLSSPGACSELGTSRVRGCAR